MSSLTKFLSTLHSWLTQPATIAAMQATLREVAPRADGASLCLLGLVLRSAQGGRSLSVLR
jgi:hypothetical protein